MKLQKRVAFRLMVVGIAALGSLGLLSCDGGSSSTTVRVTLANFSVTPDRATANHHRVKFIVTNSTAITNHEFVVVQTDLLPNALPTLADGSYDEAAVGASVVDEIDLIPPGETATLTVNLDSGHYVLICNMVAGGGGHYSLGMRTAFDVD